MTGVIGLNTTSYDISSSDSTLSDQAYTAVSSYNGNYTPDHAFDTNLTGDGNARWASTNLTGTTTIDGSSVSGPWLQVDIGQNVLVDKFTIYYLATGQEIKSAKIAASTNGSTWTEIHAITDRAHNTNVSETYNISNANYQIARYYRIVITAVQSSTIATINEWTLFGVTQAQTTAAVNFTSTSNLIVDYIKHHSTTARRLQNSDGDEVASFEITNGVLSNDQDKPTFSNVTVASGKLELTFSENIAAAGTLNVADFSVTDSGTNKPIQNPTISSGKLLIARDEYSLNGVTPYDLVSDSSALSGQTYSAFSTMGGYPTSGAFDGNTTVHNKAWISNSGYSSGNFSGSETTDGYSGAWLQVDVGQDILMSSYEIYPRPGGDTHHTKDMRLYYSDDGSNWTQLREWTGLTLAGDWKVGGSYTSLGPYTVSNIKGRYFRIVVNKLFSSGQYAQIGEFKILGITVAQGAALAFANTNVTIKYTKHDDASRHLIRVDDPSDGVDGFTITNGFDNTPAAVASKDGILIDLDQNIASSSGYAAGNFAVTESAVSKSVRAVKITPDNKVFLSMLANINKMSDTNITYTPSGTPSENLETSGGAKTLAFTITNGSDVTSRTNDRIVLNFSENIISKTTYSPNDFLVLDSVTKTSTTTFASIAVASGKLELSFNNNVAVTGALERDDFKLEDTSGNAVGFLPPTISSGKVAIEKDESIDVASTNSTLSGQTYSESSKYSTSGANLAFDNEFTTTGGGHSNHWHSSGTGTHYNTGSTHNYIGSGNHSTTVSGTAIAGEWIQVDIGQSITLTKFIVEPSRTSVSYTHLTLPTTEAV